MPDSASQNPLAQATMGTFSDVDDEAMNSSQETMLVYDEITNQNKARTMFLYGKLHESKQRNYQNMAPGCDINVITANEGIVRLEPLAYSLTSEHNVDMKYVVQLGKVIVSINGSYSRHFKGDILTIPKSGFFFFLYMEFVGIFGILRHF